MAAARLRRWGRCCRRMKKRWRVSLGTVFVLNSVALLLFPIIGHLVHFSQTQFGLVGGAGDS